MQATQQKIAIWCDMFSRTTIGFSITVAKKLTYQPMKPPDDSGTDPNLGYPCVDFPLYYQLASGIMQPLTYMVCGKNVLEIHQSPVKGCWKTAHVHH